MDKIVQKFISGPHNLKMGTRKLAARWRVSEQTVAVARDKARKMIKQDNKAVAGNYVAALEDEIVQKVNNDKGTLESTAICNYEPKNDIELAKLHRIDLTKYKISSYWSKLKSSGRFTSSVFCTLRKLEDDGGIQTSVISEAIRLSLRTELKRVPPIQVRKTNGKALIVITADEHVAAASLEDDLYPVPYDRKEYILRKMQMLEEIRKTVETAGGPFDDFINITLGDDLDGWNGGTTRSGEPGHAHVLPQNMSNGKAVETYIRTNNYYWDEVIKMGAGKTYRKYDVVNSNHGGKGLDYIANLGVQIYLEGRHPQVECNYINKFIGHFKYGKHNIVLTHGKDESYRKKPLPLNLDPTTEVFIKQYLDINNLSGGHNILLKGDLHQWNWNRGKFFHYINIGSTYGSSGWVQANFGQTDPSFAIGILDSQTNDFSLKPVYLKTSAL